MNPQASRTCLANSARPKQTATTMVAFAAFLSYACGGCLSNEYVIPKAELARLATLPPEQRGQQVRVVQSLGDRRSDAIDTSQPPPAQPEAYAQGGYGPEGPPPEGYVEESGPPVSVGVFVVGPPPPLLPPPPLFPPLPRSVGRGAPSPRGPVAGVPGRVAPPPKKPAGSGGSGLGTVSGGNSKNDLVALVIVFAILATVGMVATEGVRYDGTVAMYPWQGVHLKDGNGQEREVPLAQLTQADVASTSEAVVMDDEGWGMMRLGRGSLDRRGFAYKMNLGGMHSSCACLVADGFAADIQLGYFPHHMVGILAGWSPGIGSDTDGNSFYRHSLALEAQFFPLSVWRLHLGGFGHAGVVYADDTAGGTRHGAAFGGGAMLELSLTTRLALTARVDYTSAKTAPGGAAWQGSETFTAGIAIY
jgi:hypothetical protein